MNAAIRYQEADVVVAGGGPGGVCAAIAAARTGAKVLLVEQLGYPGGMFTGGNMSVANCWPWAGLGKEIFGRLKERGAAISHPDDPPNYPLFHFGSYAWLKNYPELKITQDLNDKGDPRRANDQISALLDSKDKKDKFDGILCLEASGGPGAAEALHRLNLDGKYPIVAMDKNPETLEWISRGAIAATVAQKSYTMAYYSLKLLDDLHHNVVHEFSKDWQTAPTSPLPTRLDTGTVVIDKTNLADFQASMATRAKPM